MTLSFRLMLITAALVLAAIAAVALVGFSQGRSASSALARESLSASQAVQNYFQERRQRELELISALMASDRAFVSYVSQALSMGTSGTAIDTASIRDLLNERRTQLGFDHAMLLDPSGRVIVDTKSIVQGRRDFSKRSGVRESLRSTAPASAVWSVENELWLVAVVPLLGGSNVEAFLVTSMVIDDAVASDIAQVSRTQLVFAVPGASGFVKAASTIDLADTQQLLAKLGQEQGRLRAASAANPVEFDAADAGGEVWRARALPIGAAEEGAWQVALVSPAQRQAVFGAVGRFVAVSSVVAVLAILLVPMAISRTVFKPLGVLAGAAERAGRGDLPQPIHVEGSAEIARLTRSFNRLLADLREQRDVENYVAELAEARGERGASGENPTPSPGGLGAAHGWLKPGTIFANRYEIRYQVARGGMGVVYRAHDRELNEAVALKTLSVDSPGGARLAELLRTEIRTARRITHPNVVRTFDFGQEGSVLYISMEFVQGVTLRDALLKTGRVRYYAALRIARQLCAGLGAAHRSGTLHGDIKPSNVMLEYNGNAKLMDFGVSRSSGGKLDARLTSSTFAGTPAYLSPEQAQGREGSERSDIYSLGIVFNEMFTGNLPISGTNTEELCLNHVSQPPIKPSEFWPEIPPMLEAIILRCLEKEPSNRYANTDALRDDLERLRV